MKKISPKEILARHIFYQIKRQTGMKKLPFTLDQFKSSELDAQKQLQTKGGYIAIRKPRRTITTAIWDDLEIRNNLEAPQNDGLVFGTLRRRR